MTTITLKINERIKKEKEFMSQFIHSIQEMKKISSGKKKGQTLQSFLDEL